MTQCMHQLLKRQTGWGIDNRDRERERERERERKNRDKWRFR